VVGTGNFFNEFQNTVFLRCEADFLSEIWRKRDYAFNPHITLYDGKDSNFARDLFNLVASYSLSFCFRVQELTLLKSLNGQQQPPLSNGDYRFTNSCMYIDKGLIEKNFGVHTDGLLYGRYTVQERLAAVETILLMIKELDKKTILNIDNNKPFRYTHRPVHAIMPMYAKSIS
jgi:hypothetical protein